jgi:hypothetical protein
MRLLVIVVSEELYKVHDATSFFTDMHRILRIVSLGNVRTLCHHRLKLLEQVIVLSLEMCWKLRLEVVSALPSLYLFWKPTLLFSFCELWHLDSDVAKSYTDRADNYMKLTNYSFVGCNRSSVCT